MSSKARFCVFVAIGALLFLEPGTAQAQSRWPNTQNVNECTQLNDPDQTRRCIEAYQGAQTDPVAAPRTPSTPLLLPMPSQPATSRRIPPPPGR